jgi:integrase
MARGKAKDRDGVFTRKDRPGTFWGSWLDANGQRRKRKLDAQTLTQARSLLAAEKLKSDKQRTLGYAEPTKDSFLSLVPRYLKHQKAAITEQSYVRVKGILESHLKPFFGAMPLGSIRRADIQTYITGRSSEVAAASVVKELNVLKHLMSLAVEWELIPFSPAARVKAPRPPAGRVRYLQPTELREVLAACPDWLRPIAGLAAFTGMRRGEMLGLRWVDVDLSGKRIMLPQTKNGDGRIVHLNRLAVKVLKAQSDDGARAGDKVFPLSNEWTADNLSKGFVAVCRRLEIEDFSFHDLRHTAASWMRMQGADIHTVALLLGHRDLRMAQRYQHLSGDHLSAAVGRLDSIFGEPKQLPEETNEEVEKAA